MDCGDRARARQHVFLLPGKHARPGRRHASPGLLPARPGPRARGAADGDGAPQDLHLERRGATPVGPRCPWPDARTPAGRAARAEPRRRGQWRCAPLGPGYGTGLSSQSVAPSLRGSLQLAAVFTTQIRKRRNGRSVLPLLGWAAGLRGTTWAQGLAAPCEARECLLWGAICCPLLSALGSWPRLWVPTGSNPVDPEGPRTLCAFWARSWMARQQGSQMLLGVRTKVVQRNSRG